MRRKFYTWGMKKKEQVSFFDKKRILRCWIWQSHTVLCTLTNKSMKLQSWPIRQWTSKSEKNKSFQFLSSLERRLVDILGPAKATCSGCQKSLWPRTCLKPWDDEDTRGSWVWEFSQGVANLWLVVELLILLGRLFRFLNYSGWFSSGFTKGTPHKDGKRFLSLLGPFSGIFLTSLMINL